MTKARVNRFDDLTFQPRFEYGDQAQATVICGPDDLVALGAGYGRMTNARFPWTIKYDEVLLVVEGELTVSIDGTDHTMTPGGYAYLPPGCDWQAHNTSDAPVRFHWIRKSYEKAAGVDIPDAFVTNERDIAPTPMPDTDGKWATTRFVDPADVRHDMHVTIVTFEPGAVIPFLETHVMEHGLYVLQGKAVYRLNEDWVEVEAGDFMWLRAFCPQACYAGGPGKFRYLLYKDVNRHMKLDPGS